MYLLSKSVGSGSERRHQRALLGSSFARSIASKQRSLAQPGEQLLHLHDVVPHPGDLLPRVALLVRTERDRVREEDPLRQREHDDLAIGLVEREGRLKFHLSVFPYGATT